MIFTLKWFKNLHNFDKIREKCHFYRGRFFFYQRQNIWPVWPDYLEKSWQHSCMGKLQIKSNILVFGFWLTFSMDDRCMMRYIHNFFISFEANLSEYGPSLLHIRMFQYLQTSFNHIARFILASTYLHKFAYKYLVWCKIHVEANIDFRANICFTFSHTGKYLLQNISFEAIVCKTSSEFLIQANICIKAKICLHIFTYYWIFAMHCFKLYREAFHKF
jgi:hypothetical protein